MRTIQVKVSEADYQKYNLEGPEISFENLVEIIILEYARNALQACNELAKEYGLSDMSHEELEAEIKAVRDAKNHS